VRLDECMRVINRRLRTAEAEVARRKQLGLQYKPWQHRIQELEEVRREIAELATPETLRTAAANPVASQATQN
jgi:hypothetical protein